MQCCVGFSPGSDWAGWALQLWAQEAVGSAAGLLQCSLEPGKEQCCSAQELLQVIAGQTAAQGRVLLGACPVICSLGAFQMESKNNSRLVWVGRPFEVIGPGTPQ